MNEVLNQDEIDALLEAMGSGDAESGEESDQASAPAASTAPAASSTSRSTPRRQRRVKIYDFKRPDKFSKDQIRTLQMMHENFARLTTTSLSALLQSLVNVHVASVDQLTYEEFIRSIPSPTCMAIINMDPLKGNSVLEIDPSITFTIIDRLFGGMGQPTRINREMTDIERSVIETTIVRILGNLRDAWQSVIDLRPRLSNIEVNPQFASFISPTEMVVLITLETKVGDVEGMTNLCIPYLTIEPIISKLSAQYWYANIRKSISKENFNVIKDRLAPIMVDVIAELGSAEVTMRDIISLRVGDTIKLDNAKVNSDLTLRIGNQKKFTCRPGLVGKRMAIQIRGHAMGTYDTFVDEAKEEGEDNE